MPPPCAVRPPFVLLRGKPVQLGQHVPSALARLLLVEAALHAGQLHSMAHDSLEGRAQTSVRQCQTQRGCMCVWLEPVAAGPAGRPQRPWCCATRGCGRGSEGARRGRPLRSEWVAARAEVRVSERVGRERLREQPTSIAFRQSVLSESGYMPRKENSGWRSATPLLIGVPVTAQRCTAWSRLTMATALHGRTQGQALASAAGTAREEVERRTWRRRTLFSVPRQGTRATTGCGPEG